MRGGDATTSPGKRRRKHRSCGRPERKGEEDSRASVSSGATRPRRRTRRKSRSRSGRSCSRHKGSRARDKRVRHEGRDFSTSHQQCDRQKEEHRRAAAGDEACAVASRKRGEAERAIEENQLDVEVALSLTQATSAIEGLVGSLKPSPTDTDMKASSIRPNADEMRALIEKLGEISTEHLCLNRVSASIDRPVPDVRKCTRDLRAVSANRRPVEKLLSECVSMSDLSSQCKEYLAFRGEASEELPTHPSEMVRVAAEMSMKVRKDERNEHFQEFVRYCLGPSFAGLQKLRGSPVEAKDVESRWESDECTPVHILHKIVHARWKELISIWPRVNDCTTALLDVIHLSNIAGESRGGAEDDAVGAAAAAAPLSKEAVEDQALGEHAPEEANTARAKNIGSSRNLSTNELKVRSGIAPDEEYSEYSGEYYSEDDAEDHAAESGKRDGSAEADDAKVAAGAKVAEAGAKVEEVARKTRAE